MSPNQVHLWRDRQLLVMHREAELPDRCLCTNRPADGQRFRAVRYWHHPWVYLMLVNLLVYTIVALFLRQRVVIRCGISQQALKQRRQGLLISWVGGILGLVIMSGAINQMPNSYDFNLRLFGGLLLGVLALLVGTKRSQLIRIQKIVGDYIWLHGVSSKFLSELPDWKTQQSGPNQKSGPN